MSERALEHLLRRDRALTLATITIIVGSAWAYVLWLAAGMDMGGMEMDGFRMVSTGIAMVMTPAEAPWSATEFALTFVMWTVMMVGMMTPSAAPMILIYARAARITAADGRPLAATGWFVGAYLLAWTAFALAATISQWALQRLAFLDPMMAASSAIVGAVALVLAGIYQLTPLKRACLMNCQSPLAFIARRGGFGTGSASALKLGAEHGLYCVGCCWALMAMLFVGGVMNPIWIAALAAFVLTEKLIPGPWLSWCLGVLLIIWAVSLLVL